MLRHLPAMNRQLSAFSRRRFIAVAGFAAPGFAGRAAEPPVPCPVLAWNEAVIRHVRRQTPPPCLVARNLAILHLALRRAWQLPGASAGSLHAAASEVCAALFSGIEPVPGLTEPADAAAARRAAAAVVESRAGDGASTTVHYHPRTEPGQWRRTPPAFRPPELPHWGRVQPFLLDAADQFRPPPPPAPGSPAAAAELEEVRKIGGADSPVRTKEETLIARFWSDFSYTTSPPGHWNDIARQIAQSRRLPLGERVRLFALLNVALADTAIATWECKYHWNAWRPVTALHAAGHGEWQSVLPSPPHPEHVSGHSAFSGAGAAVLTAFFGTDRLAFSAVSDSVPDVTRRYTSLAACADEISRSRVLAGIHFPAACREGLVLGRRTAAWTLRRFDKV